MFSDLKLPSASSRNPPASPPCSSFRSPSASAPIPSYLVRSKASSSIRCPGSSTATGLGVGLGTVYLARFYLSRILVKVPPGDPTVFLTVPALLLAIAWLACWQPARRATKVDPIEALRAE